MLGVQEVEDEHRQGGDGPVGEIEDPRRLVGQHQADARQAVDRSGGNADDDERKEIRHDLRLAPVFFAPPPQLPAEVLRTLSFLQFHKLGISETDVARLRSSYTLTTLNLVAVEPAMPLAVVIDVRRPVLMEPPSLFSE